MRVHVLLILSVVLLFTTAATGAELVVPDSYPTIMAATAAANDFDTVLVMPGTYSGSGNFDIDPGGKLLVYRGQAGAGMTIIDVGGVVGFDRRGFMITSGEDANLVVEGFTIMNAYIFDDFGTTDYPKGAGVFIEGSSPIIQDCVFRDNVAHGGGGVAATSGSNATIRRCKFISNYAEYGGGVYCWQNSPTVIELCVFDSNSVENDGGAIDFAFSSPGSVSFCAFSFNSAPVGGAIMCFDQCDTDFENCTFVANNAGLGSVLNANQSDPTLTRCLLTQNYQDLVVNCVAGSPVLECTNIYANIEGDWAIGCIASQATMNNNFSAPPLFCPDAEDPYKIAADSPCAPSHSPCGMLVGSGAVNPACVPGGNNLYINAEGTGDYPTIQAAVNASLPGDSIFLAPGTYTGDGNRDVDLNEKIVVITSSGAVDQTIIDCEGTDVEPHRAFHIFRGEDSTTVISGLTIINGVAVDHPSHPGFPMGGGIRIQASSPTIVDCRFIGGKGHAGGGIAAVFGSSPRIIGCYFEGGQTENAGGLYCWQNSPCTVTNCTFINNTATIDGGAVDCAFSSPSKFNYCTFARNTAFLGGAAQCYQSAVEFSNCTFVSNSASIGSQLSTNPGNVTVSLSIIAYGEGAGALNCVGTFSLLCTDMFGNEFGDFQDCAAGQAELFGNFSAEPMFCDTANNFYNVLASSQCAPANNSCGELIGAKAVGCSSICGDLDGLGSVSVSDAVYLLNYIFGGGAPPRDLAGGDVNCDQKATISDAVYLVNFIFGGGPAPCAGCPAPAE